MEIAFLFGLILLNGLFAMSEIALVAARKARLQKLAEAGEGAANAALQLGDDPNKFLSTVQIGITSIGVLSGIVGEATLEEVRRSHGEMNLNSAQSDRSLIENSFMASFYVYTTLESV